MTEPDDAKARLAARLADLSSEERVVIGQRLKSRRTVPSWTILPRDPAEPAQVSFAQWRLWFMEQLRPGTNAWNTPVALRLRGPLDLAALRASLEGLVERHATLRTVFDAPGGDPAPRLLEDPVVHLPVDDTPAEAAGQDAIDRFVAIEVAKPFRLDCDVTIRARLLRLGAEDHVFVLVAHHIACDGWSKSLLLKELGTTYDARAAGEEPELPALPIDYADFAAWQRDQLSGVNLERLTGYWRQRLDGCATAIALPIDRPRPVRQAFQGAVHWLSVPGPLAERTRALGRQERATPFMTLMAAFKALLFAHTDQPDILVGSPAAMRSHPELENVIGLFANTLVYRTSVSGQLNFRELIDRVRATALGVYAHQELPFEKIVEAVGPQRDPSRNPLVQVNLRVEGREPELSLRGVDVEPIALDPGIARFDLAIELGETDDGYTGYLEYDTALFDAGTTEEIARDFLAILEEAVHAPSRPLAELAALRAVRDRRGWLS